MGVPEKSVAITELIPQRPPMVMVDRFEGIDAEDQSHTSLTVREDNLFVEEGALTECGLIEHMAQSAAARVGWRCREAGEKVPYRRCLPFSGRCVAAGRCPFGNDTSDGTRGRSALFSCPAC